MKTLFLKRILSAAARSSPEGVVMADPVTYSYYLRCKAEAAEAAARGDGAQPDGRPDMDATVRVYCGVFGALDGPQPGAERI